MELRPATPSDLAGVIELDSTMESHRYLHVDQSGDGLNMQWKVEDRPLRERLIAPWPLDDNLVYLLSRSLAASKTACPWSQSMTTRCWA